MAHCTCMAGLGEVCSHAAALMYTLLAAVEHREGQACTSEPCSWAEPSQSNIKYDELANIFVKKKAEKQVQPITISSDELQHFLELLYVSETQEAIPPRKMPSFPLLRAIPPDICQRLLSWTCHHCSPVCTQAPDFNWICPHCWRKVLKYLRSYISHWSRWGLQNEDTARESYWKAMQDLHIDFHITASGLMINPDLPWIGASPDGVVTCKCHGMGVLEIKCPFTANGRTLKECARDPRFCLTEIAEGTMTLRRDHSYMFQVQAQMRVAEVMYADFVVWTPQELFTQRILFDESFFDQAYLSVEEFIRTGILPELLGKWFTVPRLSSTATADLAPEGGAIVESQLMQTSSHAWLRLANENTSIGRV
ncbi:uncharacterized protein LOC121684885 isoform X2 [Alosa sapidissima]|nr:uncharacterized protein LOC121684885 isoform X2 [Alosa sapidissima]